VAVYRFDSDGEESAGYSSTVSETSEQLDGHPRTYAPGQRQRQRARQSQPVVPPAPHDRWAAARGWSTAADRAVPPRYAPAADSYHHYHSSADIGSPVRLRSTPNSAGRPPQLSTMSRTLHVADYDDDAAERRWNGSAKYGDRQVAPDSDLQTASQPRPLAAADDGWVLSCGLVGVDNPLFIDRAHYEYIQVRHVTADASVFSPTAPARTQ